MTAKRSQKMDWWETFLWLGIFLLAAIFIYQLLKLWQAGTATASNALGSLVTALDNTLGAVENFLSNLFTSPLTALESFFGSIPDFFTQFFNWFGSLINGDIFGSFGTWLSSLWGDTVLNNAPVSTAPLNVGLGSSALGTNTNTLTGLVTAPSSFSLPTTPTGPLPPDTFSVTLPQ